MYIYTTTLTIISVSKEELRDAINTKFGINLRLKDFKPNNKYMIIRFNNINKPYNLTEIRRYVVNLYNNRSSIDNKKHIIHSWDYFGKSWTGILLEFDRYYKVKFF